VECRTSPIKVHTFEEAVAAFEALQGSVFVEK